MDQESKMIQMLSEILEKAEKNKNPETLAEKLSVNLPGIMVTILFGAISFYIFSQVQFAVIEERTKQAAVENVRIEKQFERMTTALDRLEERIRACERGQSQMRGGFGGSGGLMSPDKK